MIEVVETGMQFRVVSTGRQSSRLGGVKEINIQDPQIKKN